MVRVSLSLFRVPTIKFRKGGFEVVAAGSSGTSGARTTSSPSQQSARLSTTPVLDSELPNRYKRKPLSQEEIDYINGGGIV